VETVSVSRLEVAHHFAGGVNAGIGNYRRAQEIVAGAGFIDKELDGSHAGWPVSTLHDWAAKREHGIDAPGPHHIQ
jgi:hypothetical protein